MTFSPSRRRAATAAACALADRHPGPGPDAAPRRSPPAPPRARPAAADDVVTLGDPVPGLADLDARGTALPDGRPSARPPPASARSTCAGTSSVRRPRSCRPTACSRRATSPDPVVAARELAAAARRRVRPDRRRRSTTWSWSTPSSSRRATPARCCSARSSATWSPALGGMVTVGVANGEIAYVVLVDRQGRPATPPAAELTPRRGLARRGRTSVGRDVDAVATWSTRSTGGWTRLTVPGFAQEQQVRLRALALADGTVRPVFEANVVDAEKGSAFAYTLMVDAVTGDVLHRQNQAEANNDVFPFQGAITATECGPDHPFELTDGNTSQIVAVAAMANTAGRRRSSRSSTRTASCSPPATWAPARRPRRTPRASIPAGIYQLRVCPFDDPTVPFTPPGNYAATVTTSDTEQPGSRRRSPSRRTGATSRPTRPSTGRPAHTPQQLRGRLLDRRAPAAPPPSGPFAQRRRTRPVGHHHGHRRVDADHGRQQRQHPRGVGQPAHPRRHRAGTGLADPRVHRRRSPTPGTTPSATRPSCTPGGNDIDQVVTNLFVAHNRMHDYSLLPRLHRGELQPAARQPRPRRRRRRPGDRQRPGRRAHRRPAVVPRPRQRQPDHPAGRHPRHHEPVPLPADRRRVLRPLRRRRPRHEHRRPRVHPRHQQPDDRRPRRGHHLRAGRRHGRVVGRPDRRRVHVQPRLLQRAPTRGWSARTPPATR